MLKASIAGLSGVKKAEIEIDGITLLAGESGAGKTSIAEGIGACMVGSPLIRNIATKNKLSAVVGRGFDGAAVVIAGADGTAEMRWPAGDHKTDGKPPHASEFAVSRANVLELPPDQRVRTLQRLIKALPTKDDLAAAFKAAKIPEKAVETVAKKIDDVGWDGVVKDFTEQRARMRGEWERVTGVKFGSKIGEDWKPADWTEAYEQVTTADMEGAIAELEAKVETLVAAGAVDKARYAELKERSAAVPDLREKVAAAEDLVTGKETELLQRQQEREELPAAGDEAVIPCPMGCDGVFWSFQKNDANEVQLVATVPEQIGQDERKKRRKAIAVADGKIGHAESALWDARREVTAYQERLNAAEQAEQAIRGMTDPGETADRLADARIELDNARLILAAITARLEASRLYARIMNADRLVKVIAPEGVRKTVLNDKLGKFNENLKKLSAAVGYAPLRLDEELNAWLGTTPYHLLCSGEQIVVDAMLRAAIAKIDKSELIIVDRLEGLKGERLAKFIGVLGKLKVPALICAAMHRGEIGDSAKGADKVYWIEEGAATEVAS